MFLKQKFSLGITIIFLLVPIMVISGCDNKQTPQKYDDSPIAQKETLVQISTIDAILSGVYDGVVEFVTLRKYGDFGIGTFEGLDGEMLGFDGNFYQVKADGIAYPVSDSMLTPFASITFFDVDWERELPERINYKQLQDFLDGALPTSNIFYAIKIEGIFSYMKTRSVPAQEKPYPPLVEVTQNQPIFEFNYVEGTMVGFRCPTYVAGVNVPGYHLHFLTKSKDAGGHVLEFEIAKAVASIDYTSEFLMILPGEDSDFYEVDLTQDKQDELEKVEK